MPTAAELQRFAEASPLSVRCDECRATSAVRGVLGTVGAGAAGAQWNGNAPLLCAACGAPYARAKVHNGLTLAVRKQLRDYYTAKLQCEDPSCRECTRAISTHIARDDAGLPLFPACTVARCKGRMLKTFADKTLHTQARAHSREVTHPAPGSRGLTLSDSPRSSSSSSRSSTWPPRASASPRTTRGARTRCRCPIWPTRRRRRSTRSSGRRDATPARPARTIAATAPPNDPPAGLSRRCLTRSSRVRSIRSTSATSSAASSTAPPERAPNKRDEPCRLSAARRSARTSPATPPRPAPARPPSGAPRCAECRTHTQGLSQPPRSAAPLMICRYRASELLLTVRAEL